MPGPHPPQLTLARSRTRTQASHRRLHRCGARRGAGAETQSAGRAGLPGMLGGPVARELFIAPGHHVGGMAGARLATGLVAPTPAA